jgi:hypothetical protein
MFKFWKRKMKKFTLFNNKWHPIRFIFWIFVTKTCLEDGLEPLFCCKMQPRGPVLLKKWILGSEMVLNGGRPLWNIFGFCVMVAALP